jgi:hypothetical protein
VIKSDFNWIINNLLLVVASWKRFGNFIPLDPDPHSFEMLGQDLYSSKNLDPSPHNMNAVPKNCLGLEYLLYTVPQ